MSSTPKLERQHQILAVEALLSPTNVCMVGARDEPGGWAARIYANLKRFGFGGSIYPISLRRDRVWEQQAYPNLSAVPELPDHVLIVVPAQSAIGAIADAIAVGARSATVLSGGFTERQLAEMQGIVGQSNLALSGPNCLGNISVPASLVTSTDGRLDELRDGPIAVVGQSGGIVMALNRLLTARGIGARYVVSSGNETCLDTADFIGHFATVEGLRVVLAFVESVRDWSRFEDACRRLRASGKYLVALKVGQSASSRAAAASHTGKLAGSYAAFREVTASMGVITVDTMDAAVEVCELLSRCSPPRGGSIGAVTISGGVRELLLDAAERQRADFADLAPTTLEQLAARVEDESVSNPIDTGYAGISSTSTVVDCVELMAADPSVDVILLQEELLGRPDVKKDSALRLLNDSFPGGSARSAAKPVAVFSMATVHVTEYGRRLREECPNLAFLQGIDLTLQAVQSVGRTERSYHRHGSSRQTAGSQPSAAVRALVMASVEDSMNEVEARALLASYGFVSPPGGMAVTVKDATILAESLGYPVVVKAVSRKLRHKSDAGAVALGLRAAADVESACQRMAVALPELEGYLVSAQLPSERVEVVVGYTTDPEVGPILVVGSGGLDTELTHDVAILPVPCSREEAMEAIASTRLGTLLGPWRGRKGCDVEALTTAVCNMGRLADELSDIVESAEVNPLALIPGQPGTWALDAAVELTSRR